MRSEKIKIGKMFTILWTAIFILFFGFIFINYSSYKKVQDAGIATMQLASSKYSSSDRAEVIHDIYNDLAGYSFNNGIASARRNLQDSLEDALEALGYDDLSYIPSYFVYTNFFDYLISYMLFEVGRPVVILCFYIIIVLAFAVTVICVGDRRSALTVGDTFVTCQKGAGKSMQVMFKDIISVETTGLKGLKLSGSGIKFKIILIKNGAILKSAIMDKKIASSNESNVSDIKGTDTIKKYKELLDSGVITQEEFDTKKKQLLNL